MEKVDFATNGIEEVKNAHGEIEELRFKIKFLSLFGSIVKKFFLFIVIFIAIIFSLFTLYSVPFFLLIILAIINKKTIVVSKEKFLIKNTIPIFGSKKISILELERLAVKRVENKYANRSSSSSAVIFELYAVFKNKPAKKIFSSMNPYLVDEMDSKIESLLNIQDSTNKGQLDKISKTHYQNKLETEYINSTQNKASNEQKPINQPTESKNFNIDKPSKSFPFTVSTNLINLKIVHFYNYSGKSGGITFLIGLVFTFIGIYLPIYEKEENPFLIICALIGAPILVLGVSNIFNKRFITVSKKKINYYTKPISIKKEKEILKSQIKNIEVFFSGQRINGVPSYNIFVETKDGKNHKLIKHVFNELALKDLAAEIYHHMDLKS